MSKLKGRDWISKTRPFFLTVNQALTKKIEKKLRKNLVDWKSRCNFAACLTLNNKERRNERRKDIYKEERGKKAC